MFSLINILNSNFINVKFNTIKILYTCNITRVNINTLIKWIMYDVEVNTLDSL